MRHAVFAAALAFSPRSRMRTLMVPGATRRVARVVLGYLDRRRNLIDRS